MLQSIYQEIDHSIKKTKGFHLKQGDIVAALEISSETYRGYLSGSTSTRSVTSLLHMLSVLPDEDIIRIIKSFDSDFSQKLPVHIPVPIIEKKQLTLSLDSIDYSYYYDEIYAYEENKHMSAHGNKKGIVYTDREIARDMVSLLSPTLDETIWEPSCGAGVFLIALLEYIINTFHPTTEELVDYIESKLFFSDIDEEALEHSRYILLRFVHNEYYYTGIDVNGRLGDALLNTRIYDLIIGNPPYIRIKNLAPETLFFLRNNFNYCKKGNIDIYYAFIEMAVKCSNRSCLITPNSFIVNTSAADLRKGIAPFITHLRDHKEFKKFDTASTYTSIFVLNKKSSFTFEYSEYDNEAVSIDRSKLLGSDWKLSSNHDLHDYENRGTLFSQIAHIHSGIATLADKSYIVNKASLKNGFYEISYGGRAYLIEESICISMKKLSKYFGENGVDDKMIIFPYTGINTIMDEGELMDEFPHTYNYLLDIRAEILDRRDKGKVSEYDAWYAYGRRQGFNIDFTGKVCFVIPLVYQCGSFIYKRIEPDERFIHSSGYVIVAEDGKEEQVEEILSDVDFHTFLELNGKSMPGKEIHYNRLTATLLKQYPYLDGNSLF